MNSTSQLSLHKFSSPLKKHGRTYDYAIIDGKQRLETVWAFLDGNIALSSEFEYFRDAKIRAGDMTYAELGKAYPDLKVQFDSFQLTTVCIETDELEMIEEMFSRLNESAPLAAPERETHTAVHCRSRSANWPRRRSLGTDLPFPNKRYRHFDLATKFLLTESEGKVADTKKVYLDKFVKDHSDEPRNKMLSFLKKAKANVRRMSAVFTQGDPLLRRVGMVCEKLIASSDPNATFPWYSFSGRCRASRTPPAFHRRIGSPEPTSTPLATRPRLRTRPSRSLRAHTSVWKRAGNGLGGRAAANIRSRCGNPDSTTCSARATNTGSPSSRRHRPSRRSRTRAESRSASDSASRRRAC